MQIRWKKLRAGEPDHERKALTLAAVTLPATALLVTVWPPQWLPICMFRHWTGIPCPACGLVRSLRLLAAGRLQAAWLQQPLIIATVGLFTAVAAYAAVAVLFNLPRVRGEGVTRRTKRVLLALLVALVLANWVYLIVTNRG
jgi:hypothetical protein